MAIVASLVLNLLRLKPSHFNRKEMPPRAERHMTSLRTLCFLVQVFCRSSREQPFNCRNSDLALILAEAKCQKVVLQDHSQAEFLHMMKRLLINDRHLRGCFEPLDHFCDLSRPHCH